MDGFGSADGKLRMPSGAPADTVVSAGFVGGAIPAVPNWYDCAEPFPARRSHCYFADAAGITTNKNGRAGRSLQARRHVGAEIEN